MVTAADRAAATMRGKEYAGEGGFSERSPSPGPPPEEWCKTGVAREAASLREAPPSRSLPKSGWRLAGMLLHSWFRLLVRVLSDKLGYGHGG